MAFTIKVWPWSQREESPRGEEPRAAEARAREGPGERSRPQPAEPRAGGAARSRESGSDGWWTEEPADRDYWDIELSDGALYRIYRNRKDGTWFADGVYD